MLGAFGKPTSTYLGVSNIAQSSSFPLTVGTPSHCSQSQDAVFFGFVYNTKSAHSSRFTWYWCMSFGEACFTPIMFPIHQVTTLLSNTRCILYTTKTSAVDRVQLFCPWHINMDCALDTECAAQARCLLDSSCHCLVSRHLHIPKILRYRLPPKVPFSSSKPRPPKHGVCQHDTKVVSMSLYAEEMHPSSTPVSGGGLDLSQILDQPREVRD